MVVKLGPLEINTKKKTAELDYKLIQRRFNIIKDSTEVILKYWLKTNASATHIRKMINGDFDNLTYLNNNQKFSEKTEETTIEDIDEIILGKIFDNSLESNIETACELAIPPLCKAYNRYKTSKILHNLFTGNAKKDKKFYAMQFISLLFEIGKIFYKEIPKGVKHNYQCNVPYKAKIKT